MKINPILCSDFARRALARTSIMEIPAVSSIKMGASINLPVHSDRRCHSSSESLPVRNRWELTLASEQSSLWANCCTDISNEKYNTGVLPLMAALRAMQRVMAVLPMAGRAARITRSEACKPAVISSSSVYARQRARIFVGTFDRGEGLIHHRFQ